MKPLIGIALISFTVGLVMLWRDLTVWPFALLGFGLGFGLRWALDNITIRGHSHTGDPDEVP